MYLPTSLFSATQQYTPNYKSLQAILWNKGILYLTMSLVIKMVNLDLETIAPNLRLSLTLRGKIH